MNLSSTNTSFTIPSGEVLCPPGSTGNGSCMCDWRVQIRGCPSESTYIENLYLVNTLACFIVFIMITGLLIWRMAVKGQGLISKDPLKEMGILRPKPLECFLLLNIFHVASRLLYSVCLISDFISSTTLKEGYGKVPSSKLRNLEHGLTKLRRIRVLLLGDLIFFAVASLVFGLCRNFILTYSPVLSLFLATCWVLIVPLTNAVIITILAYEINEKARMPTLRPKTTTTFNQSRSNDYSTAHSNMPPNYPSKPVKNNQKDHKGITINLEQTVSDSKALEREQDFIDSVSQESSDSIELVVNPKHHQPSS
ncbi:9191_t:CDS:2 [Gigaspora margarita]|uniref:9191_t:CDS:1 n=1 Tax=Gigaspora margarita TaxID=4874 RepID=A0ABN7USH1_GIGMA|nr:9191_t:CDS:2 [Gigaspora margarita]